MILINFLSNDCLAETFLIKDKNQESCTNRLFRYDDEYNGVARSIQRSTKCSNCHVKLYI